MTPDPPTLAEFLAAPRAAVAAFTPATVIFAAGGTRRAAALAGVPIDERYVRWSHPRMLACYGRFLDLGVQHLIVPVAIPKMFAEHGPVRQRWLDWIGWGLAGAESLAEYRTQGWQARLVVAGTLVPELAVVAAQLAAETAAHPGPTLWYVATLSTDDLWRWVCGAVLGGARSRADLVRALYGADVPPAEILVGFGKPALGPELVPPFLVEELQCYWTQRPGYAIGEDELRRIVYDAVVLRQTWRGDKTGRAEAAALDRVAWESGPTIGLGVRRGPFWYPAALDVPPLPPEW